MHFVKKLIDKQTNKKDDKKCAYMNAFELNQIYYIFAIFATILQTVDIIIIILNFCETVVGGVVKLAQKSEHAL